jgi:Tol biopolymer transport system component
MGEVYRATDTKLGRDVAIKVLPAEVAGDPERLARFEREAKLLASLNHPNIAHVYGFESSTLPDGSTAHFLAMELVEGEDLAEHLKRGPLPVEEAAEIARQIAEALEEAHEHGIVHRDLKPANVKLTEDGKVKVLDFGLAKAYAGESGRGSPPDLSQSPTLAHTGTQAGVILGTAAYMSPEQARGKPVDKRADIWAFGTVLYQMLTGRWLFDGETVSDVLAAVLTHEPDWSALPAATPASTRILLRRCLDRDPKTRLRDIGEARVALAALPDESLPVGPGSAGRRQRWIAVAAAAIFGLAGLAVGLSLRPAPPRPLTKVDLVDEDLAVDEPHRPVLSPDGSRVAYFAQGTLRIRDLDRAEGREVPDTKAASYAFWSADGAQVAFRRGEDLFRTPVDGGAPVLVARIGPSVPGSGGCWSGDGRIVYSRGNTPLYEVSALGGEPRVLLEPDASRRENHFHGCSFLPDGRGMLFVVHPDESPSNAIALLAGGTARYLLQLPNEGVGWPAWSPSGHIVFHRRGGTGAGVWALPFDLSRLEATGEPFPVVASGTVPSVAANGSLLYAPTRAEGAGRLVWVLTDGTVEGPAVEFGHSLDGFSLSPDGTRIAAIVEAGGVGDLWVADLTRGTQTQLTHGPGAASHPDWSPDSQQIVFSRNNEVHVIDVSSGQPSRAIGHGLAPTFSPDGRSVVAQRITRNGIFELWLLDASGEGEARPLVREASSARWADVSPDGRFMAYSGGSGINQLFLTRFPDATGRWQIASGGWIRWSSDGHRLYYVGGSQEDLTSRQVFEVDFEGDPDVKLGIPRALFSLTKTGVQPELHRGTTGERFLMEAAPRAASVARLVLVQNWFEEFR